MKPTITVITATYNSSRTLAWTIQSVLNQDFTDFEYLIIGDACTDNTAEVVKSFADSRIHFVNLPKNSGSQATPNNHGLEIAQGQWIAYLGHDDLWFPWHLSSLLETAAAHNATLVYGMSAIFSPQGLELVYGVVGAGRAPKNFLVPPSSWLHKKTEQRWRMPEHLAVGIDNDFLIRLIGKKLPIAQTGRLSVLKYPSAWWGLYRRQGSFPQQQDFLEMQKELARLEHRVLLEAARLASRLYSSDLSLAQWLKLGVKPFLLSVLLKKPDFFVLRWYFQWQRAKNHSKRGLTTKSG
jgi:hypothetical protein